MDSTILAAVDDVFFLAKIRQTAEQVGAHVEVVSPSCVEERATEGNVRGIILDLNSRSSLKILQALKAQPSTRSLPVLGFVSHVQKDLIVRARAAGCDTVLARSAFTAQLPEILEKFRGLGTS